jgi:hypothetical protein
MEAVKRVLIFVGNVESIVGCVTCGQCWKERPLLQASRTNGFFGFLGAVRNLGRGDETIEIPYFHLGMALPRLLSRSPLKL